MTFYARFRTDETPIKLIIIFDHDNIIVFIEILCVYLAVGFHVGVVSRRFDISARERRLGNLSEHREIYARVSAQICKHKSKLKWSVRRKYFVINILR